MNKKIKVVIKTPGLKPYATWVSNSLENLQKHVGGYIEIVTLAENMVIICNEDLKLRNMRFNCEVCGEEFRGPIIFAGRDKDGELASLPVDFKQFKKMFSDLFK